MFRGANLFMQELEEAIARNYTAKIRLILNNTADEPGWHVLTPLPESLYQDGPVCGYTAMSAITKYWHSIACRYPFHRVRRRDSREPDAPVPLRVLAKNAGLEGIGGIFDADEFVTILQNTEYKARVLSYTSKEDLFEKIKQAIKLRIPIILPVDMSGTLVKEEGRRAHHITVVGYIEKSPNNISLVCMSDLQYHLFSLDDVFESAANLKQTHDRRFYKMPGRAGMWQNLEGRPLPDGALVHEHPSTDLQGIRMKMVLVYPNDLRSRIDPVFDNVFTSPAFKKAITNYIAYKDKFFLRWLRSSRVSHQTALQIKSAKTDKERFDIAKAFVEKHGDKQLAKNFLEVMPGLRRP